MSNHLVVSLSVIWRVYNLSLLIWMMGLLLGVDSLTVASLIRSISWKILIYISSSICLLWSCCLIFLSYKLPSESQCICMLWLLLILLICFHYIGIIRIVSVLVAYLELIIMIYTFWSLSIFHLVYNFIDVMWITSVMVHCLLQWTILIIASLSQWLLLHLNLVTYILVGHLHNMIWSQCIRWRKLMVELHKD